MVGNRNPLLIIKILNQVGLLINLGNLNLFMCTMRQYYFYKSLKLSLLLATVFLVSCTPNKKADLGIKHIIVIGVDGMSPDGINNAQTPVIDSMVKYGASTFEARAVLPSSSSSNWASMIMGADTEQHGITSNGWEANNHTLPAVVSAHDSRFPSIFTLFHDQKPEAHVGTIYDWDGFGRLYNPEDVAFDINGGHEDGTTQDAITYIKDHKPNFTFIHLDHVDHAGHSEGHGTESYYQAVEKADHLIGSIIASTKEAGIFDQTVFIISADHGGLGKGHGGESLNEVNIPFILYGAGVKNGYTIEETVYQYDNAATVAFVAGLETPQAWIGRPVKSAFVGYEKPVLRYKKQKQLLAPVLLPKNGPYAPSGGLFTTSNIEVKLKNLNTTGSIYYTLDGSDPSEKNGLEYTAPFTVDRTTLVRAIVTKAGKASSTISAGSYRLISTQKKPGVLFRIYPLENLTSLPDFRNLKASQTGNSMEFESGILDSLDSAASTAIVFNSVLKIDTSGSYTFYTNSDDGSKLYIDEKLVVDNDGDHGVQERSGTINLKTGAHPIKIEYFNGGGGYYLDAQYKGPGIGKQIIPAGKLNLN
ncbi:PA14 domain-containing protein [Leeuwenhoekiella polynyae]|uniref:PA14 domain-containing protein n=2 Tax=Leeuwenhoekiella polynyae TaxID=1550906 RepID=A0A4Q0NSC8_9FLAO|nr:PA14 domain-containing protein [Leeuwenhoekiella polynyae]